MSTANPWDPDIRLSREEAFALVCGQFPEFSSGSFDLLSSGWDNDAYIVDGRVVFRFPRRNVARQLIENELRILPLLAPHLPMPISVSRFIGEPTDDYPHVWAGYDLIPGSTACRMDWTLDQRAVNATGLGSFLKALHSIPIDDATRAWAPGDEIARTDFRARLPKVLERLSKLHSVFPDINLHAIEAMATDLAAQSQLSPKAVWVHGDLYSRHLIANTQHEVAGIIDWGDVHLGDPALDLSVAFTFLPASAYESFRKAYGEIDDATWANAKFRAISHAAAISDYGVGIKDADLLGAAEFTLRSLSH